MTKRQPDRVALTEVRRLAARTRTMEDKALEWRRALTAAILAARDAGCTLDAIGEAAGVGHQRVSQIVEDQKRRAVG